MSGGARIISDSSEGSSYAFNAYGGASDGGQVLLWQDCPKDNPDCMWIYRRGMLISARDSGLAIRPNGAAQDNASLIVSSSCTDRTDECRWLWEKGMFKNAGNSTLAIRADQGAVQLGTLSLSSTCTESDTNCTWTIESARISLGADPRTGFHAGDAPASGSELLLRPLWPCPIDDAHCTWTFKRGMILSDVDPSLAVHASSLLPASTPRLDNGCTPSNSSCTWHVDGRMIVSDGAGRGMSGDYTQFALSPLGGPMTDRSPANVFIGLAALGGQSVAGMECSAQTPGNPACPPGYSCWVDPGDPGDASVNDQCVGECYNSQNPNCLLEIGPPDPVAWSETPAPKASWTMINLMFSDQDFSWYIPSDMDHMGDAGSTADVNFLALVDSPMEFNTGSMYCPLYRGRGVYLRVNRNADPTILKQLGELNMDDPSTLADIVEFAATYFPADHYAVNFYDHGNGWPGCCGDNDLGDGSSNHGFLSIPGGAYGQTLGLMTNAIGGVKLDLVTLDACFMGAWEVAAASTPFAKYMVGSENMSGATLSYAPVYAQMISQPSLSPAQVAALFASTYRVYTGEGGYTMAATDLSSTFFGDSGALTTAINNLAMTIKSPNYFDCVETARVAALGFSATIYEAWYRDLYDLADQIGIACARYGVGPLTDAIKQAVSDGAQHAVIAQNNPTVPRYPHGLSIEVPAQCTQTVSDNLRTQPEYYAGPGSSWSQQTQWGEFVRGFSPPPSELTDDHRPLPPSALTVTSVTDRSPTLVWSSSPTHGVYYTVLRGTSPGDHPTVVVSGPTFTATTITDSGLDDGTRYYYTVLANNCGATSDSAPETSVGPPSVSITAPGGGANFVAPATITIRASAIPVDAGSSIQKVEFYSGSTRLFTDTTAPYRYTWWNVAVGTYVLTAKAFDNRGFIATSTPITVTVSNRPVVSITAPANNTKYSAPASITITATASEAGGTINRVEFYQGASLLGTDTTAPYSYTWNGVPAGTYTLTAKAWDSFGVSVTSTPVTVVVNSDPCTGLCSPWVVWPGPGIQQSYLGTGAICDETTANLLGGNCGNMTGRTLKVNGTTMTCNGQTWQTLPAKRNSGYCIQVTAGGYAYAYYTTW